MWGREVTAHTAIRVRNVVSDMPIDVETFQKGDERYSIENEIIYFLHDNRDRAYNVHEVTKAVMEPGWSETNAEQPISDEERLGRILDATTVSGILDKLVDNGGVERRIVDDGSGRRSYYRAT